MKKAERLMDLVAYLLNARRPITFEEIQNAFPEDYRDGKEEAIARKFERDKADIVRLGLPLRYATNDDVDAGGYIIDRDSYALPALQLGPEELAMLYVVGTTALETENSPFEQDLVLALNKIGFAAGENGSRTFANLRVLPDRKLGGSTSLRRKDYLESLHRAIADRKSVLIFYHSFWRDEKTKRDVDPYGLVCVRGAWFLVGKCKLREAIRVFHLDRITGLEVNRFKPKTPDFTFPEGFELQDYFARDPWQIKAHEPEEVCLRIDPPVSDAFIAELGSAVTNVEE
ncbi:MAG: WYL domain-containing protein, partial [Chloroflexi bacterium]